MAAEIGDAPFSKYSIISEKEMRKVSEERIERFDIRPRDPRNLAMGFSGGNAQKIVVARELGAPGKKLLLAAQPTRGVDIGSIEGIRRLIDKAKRCLLYTSIICRKAIMMLRPRCYARILKISRFILQIRDPSTHAE